jgi:very-short-patch-repair endonuclease
MSGRRRDPMDKIRDWASDYVEANCISLREVAERRCESPIEVAMAVALWTYFTIVEQRSTEFWAPFQSDIDGVEPDNVVIAPQYLCAGYRADFVVAIGTDSGMLTAAVECDGHDFHERTKEQAARDRKRDREMQVEFDIVLRFTGSEIYRDPMKCAEDVGRRLSDVYAKLVDMGAAK